MKSLTDVCDIVCTNPLDKFTWQEWKDAFKDEGLTILEDESALGDTEEISADTARLAISCCKIQLPESEIEVVEAGNKISIKEWRDQYTKISQEFPLGRTLYTEKSNPVRLEINLPPDKPPFIFTRAYVPKIVGCKLDWFVQGKDDNNEFGLKVIILNKSRDEVIRKFGLRDSLVFVKAVTITKLSTSGKSLLGVVSEW